MIRRDEDAMVRKNYEGSFETKDGCRATPSSVTLMRVPASWTAPEKTSRGVVGWPTGDQNA
jgi:hypothetical protein